MSRSIQHAKGGSRLHARTVRAKAGAFPSPNRDGRVSYIVVFLGAGIGGALRHGVNSAALRLGLVAFPVATLFINVVGSLAMGLIAGWFAMRGQAPQSW